VNRGRLGAEAFAIIPEGTVITVLGGDNRGLIYGALAVAEAVRNGTPLEAVPAAEERPHLPFRGIKFNLPWDTYRPSSALDQHVATARDPKYWEAFLDMMAANRFNVVSLWNLHPFTYMIRPRNFPEASPWSDEEFAQWQHLYREIFRLAKVIETCTSEHPSALPQARHFSSIRHKKMKTLTKLFVVLVQHNVLTIDEAQRLLLALPLTICHQHAAAGHCLKILRHVLAQADISAEENSHPVERIAIFVPRLSSHDLQPMFACCSFEKRFTRLIIIATQTPNEAQLNVSREAHVIQLCTIVALG